MEEQSEFPELEFEGDGRVRGSRPFVKHGSEKYAWGEAG
jgi:hypothetical protein